MKQSTNTKAEYRYVPATRAQKIWGVVALAGLFACGLIIGLTWRGNSQSSATGDIVQFTEAQCESLANSIVFATSSSSDTSDEKLTSMNQIYTANCAGRVFPAEQAEMPSEDTSDMKTCEKIEQLLLRRLYPSDSPDYNAHIDNAELYKNVSKYGCPENAEKYKQLADDEMAIAVALDGGMGTVANNTRTCDEIENALKSQLREIQPWSNIEDRLHNADIYSTMAERGCPENAERYKALALRQIDVVSAVSDKQELFENKESIVETYQKLQMQEAARNFLNKLDRLIKPTTDLIYEIGKVVNE